MEGKENITERILLIMEKEGHSVSSFARKLGISWTTVNNIVSGRNMPSYDNIVKIIEGFEWVDANWLVMGQKSEPEMDKKKLYSVIATQQKTIESQQKTIDRLTARLVQELPDEPSPKAANAG
ncbi:helix-turn-helix transcriptional regulator [Prevotella sp. oral taxon 376]|uniref:helix-turn-helix domain-containing protein n=1 Tax=Prevotella sp. oral taxon 376 TaxID=712466 RepID=UPI001E528920|nr:helix-turn-helix transcriptional regulator [Prevotella sp. oral taxon 376]